MTLQITGSMLLQGVVSGLLAGGLYAMVALGLALIFGVMRVINLAHGTLLMLGAYTTFWLFSLYKLNPFVSLLVSFPLVFVLGVFVQNLAMLAWTSDFRSVEFLTGSYLIGPVAISKPRLIAFSVALAVTGLA